VRNSQVIYKKVAIKKLAIDAVKEGGTKEREIELERQNRQALTDGQMLQLERTSRKIEAHFGCPQDIEWCWADDTFYMLQSRPITTLPHPRGPWSRKSRLRICRAPANDDGSHQTTGIVSFPAHRCQAHVSGGWKVIC
jgi:Pyruvate phosphate dikinase, AMP/ATP-binding domain